MRGNIVIIIRFLFIILLLIFTVTGSAKTALNPLDFGLNTAKSAADSYNILYTCHQEAKRIGANVTYQGIDTIYLDIPAGARSIPLTKNVDFAGVVLIVNNESTDHWLFDMLNSSKPSTIGLDDIERGKLKDVKNGLLIIKDEELWVKERKGYGIGHTRMDLLYVQDGIIKNNTIYPYNTPNSRPKVDFCEVDNCEKKISNITIVRTKNSSFRTFCFRILNQNNICLNNITIKTPESNLYGDTSIKIDNCANVILNHINIDGTYSQLNKHGYGISLNNVWNVICRNIDAYGKWGVFGTNNVNKIVLDNCNINRFDIHCYGRDVIAQNCNFVNLYNQFSGIYGFIKFKKCTFANCIPLLIESSYNAYTPFELEWKDCIFNLSAKKNYLLTLFGVPEVYNERPELRRKCLPNILARNCKVILDEDVNKWYLIHTGGVKYKDSFDYMTNVTLKNVKVEGNRNAEFVLSTEELSTTIPLIKTIDLRIKTR